jgi:hypothetical protein
MTEQAGIRSQEALQVRFVTRVTESHALEVGDVEGHVASLSRFSGLAFLPDGAVGIVHFASLTNYTDGAGTFTLFPIIAFDDGSTLCLESRGYGIVDGTKTRFTGTLTVLGGSGRFDHAKGNGTLTGTRYTPLSVGADLVSDYTINIEK